MAKWHVDCSEGSDRPLAPTDTVDPQTSPGGPAGRRVERRRHARLLRRFWRALTQSRSCADVYHLIVNTMARAVDAEVGSLAVYQDLESSLVVTATRGYPQVLVEHVRIAPGEGVIGRVFASGKAECGTARADSSSGRPRRYRQSSYIAMPLMSAEGVLGVVSFTDRETGEPFSRRDVRRLRLYTEAAALALSRELLRDQARDLSRQATIDPLTGLFNRRHFDMRLQQELERQRRQAESLALLMLDVDDFKRLNDSLGHLAGDRVLREVAEILSRAVRIFDVCARYGGEEFAILMPGASADTAVQIAERIRLQVEQFFAAARHRGGRHLTVSIGAATAEHAMAPDELVGAADDALRRAKRAGKNAVCLHAQP